MAALWIWGLPAKRAGLLTAAATLLLAMAINFAIGSVWYHPRPFEIGIGHTLVKHALETSFPSDHATFLWSLSFGLIAASVRRGWGLVIGGLGFATAWARVYLGVHFPFDMFGSFMVAVLSAACTYAMRRPIERNLMPASERFYETILRVLHVPAAVIPRQPD
jgi:undecaprenyl-diphosphatase